MSVRILLNHKKDEYYTNFDIVHGTVELQLNSSESVSSVLVKVEGLSKSLCYTEPGSGKTRSKTPVTEIHKVLYLTEEVFPEKSLRKRSSGTAFTLPPGKHVWSFSFQIPVNNDCKNEARVKTSFSGLLQASNAASQRHVQQILPPSMSGTEEVWVRYFVKATVVRPSMLAMNRREYAPFIFLPIEAPRAEQGSDAQAFFVKRQHTLSLPEEFRRNGLRSLFSDMRPRVGDTIAVEVRMPNPPSVVPGLPVNMDIMGFFESDRNNNSLRITKVVMALSVTTKLRAGGLKRLLGGRIPCYSQDFNVPFTQQIDSRQPAALLQLIKAAPFTVATDTPPTFSTCNISRSYSLEIAVTITQGQKTKETVVLNCPITVLSGVHAPPPQETRQSGSMGAYHVGPSSSAAASGSGPGAVGGAVQTDNNDLPSYKEAVQVGAPSSRPRVPVMTSRTALRTRTSYRVGQDYYQVPVQET